MPATLERAEGLELDERVLKGEREGLSSTCAQAFDGLTRQLDLQAVLAEAEARGHVDLCERQALVFLVAVRPDDDPAQDVGRLILGRAEVARRVRGVDGQFDLVLPLSREPDAHGLGAVLIGVGDQAGLGGDCIDREQETTAVIKWPGGVERDRLNAQAVHRDACEDLRAW